MYFIEKLVVFDCECIFECVVYVCGIGVYGYYENLVDFLDEILVVLF